MTPCFFSRFDTSSKASNWHAIYARFFFGGLVKLPKRISKVKRDSWSFPVQKFLGTTHTKGQFRIGRFEVEEPPWDQVMDVSNYLKNEILQIWHPRSRTFSPQKNGGWKTNCLSYWDGRYLWKILGIFEIDFRLKVVGSPWFQWSLFVKPEEPRWVDEDASHLAVGADRKSRSFL